MPESKIFIIFFGSLMSLLQAFFLLILAQLAGDIRSVAKAFNAHLADHAKGNFK